MVKTLIYIITDDDNDKSSTSIKLPDAATDVDVTEFAQGQAPLLDDIIDGKIESSSFNVPIDISALTGNVLSGNSDVEEVAAFSFITLNGEPVRINVPCMNENIVTAGSDAIDQAHPTVAPFLTAMLNGLTTTGGNVAPCAKNEDDITATSYARENARSSGKRA